MFKDKNGNEVTIGDTVTPDDLDTEYVIVSKGPCSDFPDEDEVLYGQFKGDMRLLTMLTKDFLAEKWIKKED